MKVKRLNKNAVLPKYAKNGDSGFDLVAVEDTIIFPKETVLVKTGLAFDIPEGYEIQVRPRSGISLKSQLLVKLGTVDSGYRGEVGVIVLNYASDKYIDQDMTFDINGRPVYYNNEDQKFPGCSYFIRKGDRTAQGVLAPVAHTIFEEVDDLSESERGVGGYGSTGVST